MSQSLIETFLLYDIRDIPRQLQFMINNIVVLQEFMQMSEEGWKRFARDIEYANRKHDWNLQVGGATDEKAVADS